ncbi:MAG: tRNA (adenosine(37)-N6)-threonylcarbamoyltransferase complex transferase subunit TsaD [Clostridia bacterium]|nr:tRNA (adenosine(37)-N6)-threonylcarbamoyltransferase complex transferase subunit TsaD [Clostridia bacterium]
MKILSIESSCDETAAAVVEGRTVLSNIVATQIAEHRIYGGVVPEIASRRHTEAISAVTEEALKEAGIGYKDLSAIAVTYAPGLIGALLVGVNFAKGLSLALDIPLIPVHHLRGHIAANYLAHPDLEPPFLCLTVSGGNTLLTEVNGYTDFTVIGQTRDDAAGECFDKTARALGLSYPGGVMLDQIATTADPVAYPLPRPHVDGGTYDFSFSGLKTAVINLIHRTAQKNGEIDVPVLAATVRQRVCDLLIEKTLAAAEDRGHDTVVLAGGVSANSELRSRMSAECQQRGLKLYYPPLCYCGDNAAMIGVQASYEMAAGHLGDVSLNAVATLPIETNYLPEGSNS